jgi:AraC-like DNA-binding protein/mannose-6-phosphate isomerase-like protein (cupin superfamily)
MDFFSEQLPIGERAAGYEAALRRYFSQAETDIRVQLMPACPEAFAASLEWVTLGRLGGAIHRTNSPHVLHAPAVRAPRPELEFYCIHSGEISFALDTGPIRLSSGDLFLLPPGIEFVAQLEHVEMLAVGVPGDLLGGVDPRRARLAHRISADCGFASCVGALVRAAGARHRDLSAAEAAVLQMAVVDAIRLWMSREPDGEEAGLCEQQLQKLNEVKTLALRSLRSPSLNPETLAHQAGISPRTLHRLFHGSGTTFRSWLRDCRLERCWMELTDAGRHRDSVALVAFGWGFNDLTTFNRAFKERYGVTPRAAREGARPGRSASQ